MHELAVRGPRPPSIVVNFAGAASACTLVTSDEVGHGSPVSRKIHVLTLILAAGCAAGDAGPDATATLSPLSGSGVSGKIDFTVLEDGAVRIDADLKGLTPGMHGMHVHEFGDCSAADGMSAGGHFNPDMVEHGAPNSATHHPGDYGNLEADATGHAALSLTVAAGTFSVTDGDKLNILGRGVIVHEKLDDFGQPTGNAGGRVACGVINVAGGTSPPVVNPNPGA